MARFFKNMSLLYKISLTVGGCILVVEILLMIPSIVLKKSQLLEQFHQQNYQFLRTIENPLSSHLSSSDFSEAKKLFYVVQEQPGFLGYWIMDAHNTVLLASHLKKPGEVQNNQWKSLPFKNFSAARNSNGGVMYRYEMASRDRNRSFAVYSLFSTRSIDREIRSYAMNIFLLTLIIMTLTSLTVILILRSIVIRPIRKIVMANKGADFIDSRAFPGDEIGTIMASRDKMLRQLMDYQNHLEEMVNQRTEELHHAYKKLKILDRVKDDFLTLISHEMRTPLAVIQNSFDLFKDRILNGKEVQERFINMGLDSTERLKKLANLSLDIATLNAHRLLFQKKPFDLATAVEEAMNAMIPVSQKRGVNTNFENTVLENVSIEGHRERFLKIMEYVIENAIEASQKGDSVIVKLEAQQNRVVIQVKDSGSGMPVESQKYIFKPFHRSEDILSHSKGLGLSLFWAKRVLRFMGGRIYFLSQAGRGTTFFIEMPRLQVNDNAVQSKAA